MCIDIQISSKSAKRFRRYRDFSIFNMAAVRHLEFLNFWIFGRPSDRKAWYASSYQISPKSVKQLLLYSNLSFISRWRPSAILDMWGKFWDNPQREFGGVYQCATFSLWVVTDRQTDRHTTTAYTALSIASRGNQETSYLVYRLTVASPSQRTTNRPWKGRGYVTWHVFYRATAMLTC